MTRLLFFLFIIGGCNSEFAVERKTVSGSVALQSAQMSDAQWENGAMGLSYVEPDHTQVLEDFQANIGNFTNLAGVTLGDRRILGHYTRTYYDESSGYLSLLQGLDHLTIVDTNKTVTVLDDVVIAYYSPTTTPAITGKVKFVDIDETNDLIYIASENSGVYSIYTNGTPDLTDDVQVGIYNLADLGFVGHFSQVYVDEVNDLVYIAFGIALRIYNRNGTVSDADDTFVMQYDHNSTPKWLDGAVVAQFEIDHANNQIRASTYPWNGSFYIIDTNGTPLVQADDTIYSRPPPTTGGYNSVNGFNYDAASGYVVISSHGNTSKGIIQIIDTKFTQSMADDVLVKSYAATDFHPTNYYYTSTYHISTKTIYLQGWNNAVSVALNSLSDPADDVITQMPGFEGQPLYQSVITTDQLNGKLYYKTKSGMTEYLPGKLIDQARIVSAPIEVTTVKSSISWVGSGGGNLAFEVRTGDSNAFKNFSLSTSTAADWSDQYGWGNPASAVTNNGGVISLSGFAANAESYNWYNTGVAADGFPGGSTVRVRARANCSAPVEIWVFEDDWWSDDNETVVNSDWVEFEFNALTPFSHVGFWIFAPGGQTLDTICTSVDIDSVKIFLTDSFWNAWTPVTNGEGLNISAPTHTVMQYRATLSSVSGAAPVLESVTVKDARESSGEFISDVNFPRAKRPFKIEYTGNIPAGTSVAFSYSLDAGASWTSLPGTTFPSGIAPVSAIKVKASLTTTDPTLSPSIRSLTVLAK